MENCSKMSDIQTYTYNSPPQPNSLPQREEAFELGAHTSSNMKVKRPKVTPNDLNIVLTTKPVFSDKEATKRMQTINTDIYEGAKKEKDKHEFNLKRYFTIFGLFALLTAAITYFRRK